MHFKFNMTAHKERLPNRDNTIQYNTIQYNTIQYNTKTIINLRFCCNYHICYDMVDFLSFYQK